MVHLELRNKAKKNIKSIFPNNEQKQHDLWKTLVLEADDCIGIKDCDKHSFYIHIYNATVRILNQTLKIRENER